MRPMRAKVGVPVGPVWPAAGGDRAYVMVGGVVCPEDGGRLEPVHLAARTEGGGWLALDATTPSARLEKN